MPKDHVSQNLKLTIDQVSQLTGVSKSMLRYWEKSFPIFLHPARTLSNRREYSMGDLDVVKKIKRLREEEHLTAEGVRLRLNKEVRPRNDPLRRGKKPAKALETDKRSAICLPP